MIVDGVEVLYTMRNGKIVDPNIPMDGLVCYLDARGKTNNDKHKGTLLDLSGNGNHGTLQNFNFTEESGYVNDSSGGLKFDGVDDTIIFSFNPSLKDHTIIIEADFSAYDENKLHRFYDSNNMAIYRTKLNKLEFYVKNPATFRSTTDIVKKIIIRGDTSNVEILTNTDYHVTSLPPTPWINKITLGNDYSNEFGKLKLEKFMVWNRKLTDEEIQQLMEVE